MEEQLHANFVAIVEDVKRKAIENKKKTEEEAQEIADFFSDNIERNLNDVAQNTSTHTLKLHNARANAKAAFLVVDTSQSRYFYTGGMTKYMPHALLPMFTKKLEVNGKPYDSFINIILSDDEELAQHAASEFQQFVLSLGCDKQVADSFIKTLKSRVSNIHDAPLVSNEVNKEHPGSAHNVPVVWIPHGDQELVITPIVSLGEHIEISNVYRNAKEHLVDLQAVIKEFLATFKQRETCCKETLVEELHEVVQFEHSKEEHVDAQLDVLFTNIQLLLADIMNDESLSYDKALTLIEATLIKKSGATTNIINKEIGRFDFCVDTFSFSDQPQNITNALSANDYVKKRYKLKASFPCTDDNNKFIESLKFEKYLNEDTKQYPLIQNEKLGELLVAIYSLENRGRKLYKPEVDSLTKLVKFCRNLIIKQIHKTNEELERIRLEKEIDNDFSTPNPFEALKFVNFNYVKKPTGVSSNDIREFVCSPVVEKLFNKGY